MPTDPSAGPSSPSPAEPTPERWEISRCVSDMLSAKVIRIDQVHPMDPFLSALVRSVEERTLREALEPIANRLKMADATVAYERNDRNTPSWRLHQNEGAVSAYAEAVAILRSRLASLKETRER